MGIFEKEHWIALGAEGHAPHLHGKLADFGISALIGAGPTGAESVTGTAAYLSPEQAAANNFRMEGARLFLSILMTLGDIPLKDTQPKDEGLKYDTK